MQIDAGIRYQSIVGLGSSLEPSTCANIARLAPADREAFMESVVDPVHGIGMNLMRICIGTPDFTGDPWYSYCDLPPGESDPQLKTFSIEPDRKTILPALQLARRKNSDLRFFASPWSPPGWMKSSGSLIGGRLLPEWYAAYAEYFVRFIRAYAAEGVPVDAVTVQNEPGIDRARDQDSKWHYPSCHWTAAEERDFIVDHLGPAFERAGLTTEIWCFDHNYNTQPSEFDAGIEHPRTILRDRRAARFVRGVAFHGYVGEPVGMSLVHAEFPEVPLHFSEGSVFGIGGAGELIDRLRHWATSYNAWVLMLDERGQPNRGPFPATHATLRLNTGHAGRAPTVEKLLEYYVYGQFMKFVPRGSVRIESRAVGDLPKQIALARPDGHIVLIAANPDKSRREFEIRFRGRACLFTLPPESVGTWLWRDEP